MSKGAINKYIEQLNLTPAQIRTAIKLLGIDTALAQITGLGNSIAALPSQKVIDIIVRRGFHAGGLVMHDGGLAPDEVPAILQRGEFVMSRRATKGVGVGLLSMLNRMHEGGLSSLPSRASAGGGSSVGLPSGDVYLQVDGQTLARISRAELLKLKGSRVSLGLS